MNDIKPAEQAKLYALYTFLGLLIIPVIFITTEFITRNIKFNSVGFTSLFTDSTQYWFIIALPILIGFAVFYISKFYLEKTLKLEQLLENEEQKSKITLEFIDKIVQGETNIEYQIKNDTDLLGKSLINLRDNIIDNRQLEDQRRKEDEQRNWVAEGIAKFSEILRQDNDNIEELSYNVVVNLVRYTDSNQGGFYILDDNNQSNKYFEQTACYAYDRKKFSDRTVEWGEGLIGTCAQEKQTIYMTDVPDSYLNITSGLGKANPKSLLLVPLMINEEVHGVLELASFIPFEKYKINFIEKVAESIASTISTVKINVRTSKLLDESREQAETLAAQEEQMRQNMEELQATQEEAARQAEKFISFTNSVNHTLIRAEYYTDGTLLYANTKFLKKLGYKGNSEVEGKHISMFINEKDRDWFFKIWDGLAKGGRHFEGDMKHVTKQGNDLWTMATYTCVRRDDGSVEKILFLAIDTTDQKQQSLDYEGQIEALNNTNIKAEFDPDGSYISCNELFLETMKYTLPEMKNKTIFDFIDRAELDIFRENWENVTEGISFMGQYKVLTKTKDEKWLRVSYSPVNNMYGEVANIIFLATDMTNEKLMELETKRQTEQLKEQEEQLRMASVDLNKKLNLAKTEMKNQFKEIEKSKLRSERTLEGALDAIFTMNEEGNINFFNKAAEELWKIDRKEVIGRNVRHLFSEETIKNNEFVTKLVTPGESKIVGKRTEISIKNIDNEEIPALFLLSDATVDNELSITAFIQNIEVELF